MSKVVFGNHSSVLVPRQDRDNIRKFYCNILGGRITKVDPERDFVLLNDNFYIVFLYGDVPDESNFLRTARSIWLNQIRQRRRDKAQNPGIRSGQKARHSGSSFIFSSARWPVSAPRRHRRGSLFLRRRTRRSGRTKGKSSAQE